MESHTLPPSQPRAWWREPMLWLVIGGPLSVVVASIVSAIVAWSAIDPVLSINDPSEAQSARVNTKSALAPAQRARNHAATPVKPD